MPIKAMLFCSSVLALLCKSLLVLSDAQYLSKFARSMDAAEPLGVLEARIVDGGGNPMDSSMPDVLINIEGEQWVLSSLTINPLTHL